MTYKKINCIHADNPGGYCKNKKVKRSLFGVGARLCVKYDYESTPCPYHQSFAKPTAPPPKKRY